MTLLIEAYKISYQTLHPFRLLIRDTLIPLLAILLFPFGAILVPYIVVEKKGNIIETFNGRTLGQVVLDAWATVNWSDTNCWLIVAGSLAWCWSTLRWLPGRMYYGPLTKTGYRPQYWHNAVLFYVLTMAIAIPVIWSYSMLSMYCRFTTLAGILNVCGFGYCVLLFIKGHLAPDCGFNQPSGNPIYDFFCGLEHYPLLGRFINLKVLLVSRYGHLLWQLVLLVALKASFELHGRIHLPLALNVFLQSIYIAKSLHWEDGYMAAFDTTYDSLGFIICWGTTVLVPTVYSISSLYLVEHPLPSYSTPLALVSLVVGISAILLGYWTDYQRQVIRRTDGQCTIWGRTPVVIRAKWIDDQGNEHSSVLLASGFWGVARHFNYTTDIIIFISFSLPALFSSPIPFCIPTSLPILLLHRASRNDGHCRAKYGKYWEQYCEAVPYSLVPGVF